MCAMRTSLLFAVTAAIACVACGGDDTGSGGHGGSGGAAPGATEAVFDLDADFHSPEHFYDAPFPSDIRLTSQGGPDLTGLPFPTNLRMFDSLRKVAMEHVGTPI